MLLSARRWKRSLSRAALGIQKQQQLLMLPQQRAPSETPLAAEPAPSSSLQARAQRWCRADVEREQPRRRCRRRLARQGGRDTTLAGRWRVSRLQQRRRPSSSDQPAIWRTLMSRFSAVSQVPHSSQSLVVSSTWGGD